MHVTIAVPCFGGMIFAHCHRSIVALTHALAAAGHSFTLEHVYNESLVQRARNVLVHRFMAANSDALLFIDADIEFDPAHVLGLIAADQPIVCGAYPKKAFDESVLAKGGERVLRRATSFAINPDVHAGTRHELEGERAEVEYKAVRGCIPILDAATGFLLVRREVFERMAAEMPEIQYLSDDPRDRGAPYHAYFDCQIEPETRRYLSEDYLFSRRAQRLGYTVWLYLGADLAHVGTHVYRGDLLGMFKPTPAVHRASEWTDIPTLPMNDPQRRWHIERYEWARDRLAGRDSMRIVNAACGSGYGSPMLPGWPGCTVLGLDRNAEAIAIAQRKYASERCVFAQVADLEEQTLAGYDTLVCLETLEHLRHPWGWLSRLDASVREMVLSVPVIPTKHANEYHLHDFTRADVISRLVELDWRILETRDQAEYVSDAVLLVHARRRG